MKKFNIKCPSEKKMRIVEREYLDGKKILCEKTPFIFIKDKQHVMKTAPMAYIPNVKEFVFAHLDYLDK